jgi:streptogramin lyase
VTAIDPATDEIIGAADVGDASDTISVSVGEGAVWAVVGERSLVRVDPKTFAVDDIEQVQDPVDVAARDGAIWVLDSKQGLLKLDPPTSTLLGRPITVPAGQGDISAGRGVVWIADKKDDTLIRIDAATSAVTGIFQVEGTYLDLALTETSTWVLSATDGHGLLTALDPVTGDALGTPIALEGDPVEVSVGGSGVWVVARAGGAILRIDPEASTD